LQLEKKGGFTDEESHLNTQEDSCQGKSEAPTVPAKYRQTPTAGTAPQALQCPSRGGEAPPRGEAPPGEITKETGSEAADETPPEFSPGDLGSEETRSDGVEGKAAPQGLEPPYDEESDPDQPLGEEHPQTDSHRNVKGGQSKVKMPGKTPVEENPSVHCLPAPAAAQDEGGVADCHSDLPARRK